MAKLSLSKWAALVIVGAGGLTVLFLGMRYLFPALLPFLLAWGFAFLLRPVSCFLAEKWRIPKKAGAVAANLLTLGAVFLLLYFLLRQMLSEGQELLVWLKDNPHRIDAFFSKLNALLDRFRPLFPHLSQNGTDMAQQILAYGVEAALGKLPEFLGAVLKALPGIVLFAGVTLIASVYFALDLDGINQRLMGLLPPSWREALRRSKAGVLKTALAYLKSYLLLMGMTFGLVLLGFLAFKIPYALLLAFICALLDVLPVLGIGTMLIPWGLFCLLFGQTGRGVVLLVIYGVAVIVRQLAEPKILGEHLGIHPLLMLVYLYGGLKIFGLWGIFLGPAIGVVVRGCFGVFGQNPHPKTQKSPQESRNPAE